MPVQLIYQLFNSSHCASDTFWWDCVFCSWMALWGLAQLIPSTLEEIQIAATALGNPRFCDVSFWPFPAQVLCSSSFAELTGFSVLMVHGVISEASCHACLSNEVAEVAGHVPPPNNSTFGISDFWWQQPTAEDSNLICYNKIC